MVETTGLYMNRLNIGIILTHGSVVWQDHLSVGNGISQPDKSLFPLNPASPVILEHIVLWVLSTLLVHLHKASSSCGWAILPFSSVWGTELVILIPLHNGGMQSVLVSLK